MFGRAARPGASTDTVVPLHFFDDMPVWKSIVLYSMFVFDDVLDPVKLRDALQALLQRDGWRKVGARLRYNAKGGVEYHIPQDFTPERPAINYTHILHDIEAAAHPVASLIPKPSRQPAAVCDPDTFGPLFYPEDGPRNLNDYLDKDMPQLGLHIVSFKDKTIVCLHWPHSLMDIMAKGALINAWGLMLQGRADEVPTPIGFADDPLAELGKYPSEPHELAPQRLSMFGLARYGIGSMLATYMCAKESRMVCVPAAFVARLRREALADLATEPEPGVSFLSENDVLCAWWARLATIHLPRGSGRTVAISLTHSWRDLLADEMLSAEGKGEDQGGRARPYLSNAFGMLYVLMPADEVASSRLGHVAAAIRRTVARTGSRTQVEAFAAMWRESMGSIPPLFGTADMHMVVMSNWSKARLYETDFSAAIVAPGEGRAGDPATAGRPTYIQNKNYELSMLNGFPIMGKDREGNYWLQGHMNKGNWAKIEEQMANL